MSATPMKIGMYYFERMMTSKSTPVVLTISPERVQVVSDRVLLDTPPAHLQLKLGKLTAAITLLAPAGKLILAGLGSHTGAAHTSQQEAEIAQAQQIASQDPQISHIELSQTLWLGRTTSADGSYYGSLRSLRAKDASVQKAVGKMVHEALLAAGVPSA